MPLYFAMTGTRSYNILIILQLANIIVLGIQVRKLTQTHGLRPHGAKHCFLQTRAKHALTAPWRNPQQVFLRETSFGRGYPNTSCISFATRRNMPEYADRLLCLRVHIQTFGKNGTDVQTPIQTVIQTVRKNGTDVQTVES